MRPYAGGFFQLFRLRPRGSQLSEKTAKVLGEIMHKNLLALLGVFMLAFNTTTVRADDTAPLDYAKINSIIQALLDPLAGDDPIVSAVGMRLNPDNTDLVNDKLQLELTTDLRRTTWSEAPTRFTTILRGQARILPGETPEAAEVLELRIGSDFEVATDAVPMLRYMSVQIKDLVGCSRATRPSQEFVCVKLAELGTVDSLESVSGLLVGVRDGLVLLIDEEINRLKAAIAAAPSDIDLERLATELKTVLDQKRFVGALTLNTAMDEAGAVKEIQVASGRPLALGRDIRLDSGRIVLAREKLTIGFAINARNLFPARDYQAFKGMLVDLFREVESGNPDALETVKSYASMYMEVIKGFTNSNRR